MADEVNNILSPDHDDRHREEELLKQLQQALHDEDDSLPDDAVLDEDAFETDAEEGLSQMKSPQQMELILYQLNKDLRDKTARKTTLVNKKTLKPQWVLYFAIFILLFIIILIFIYLRKNSGV